MKEDEMRLTVERLKDILGKVSEEIEVKREEAEGLKQEAERRIEVTDAVFQIFKKMKSKGIQKSFITRKGIETIGIFCCDGIKSDFYSIELIRQESKVLIDIKVTNAIKRIKGILFLEPMPIDDIQALKEWISEMQLALADNHLNEFLEVIQQITSQTSGNFEVGILF